MMKDAIPVKAVKGSDKSQETASDKSQGSPKSATQNKLEQIAEAFKEELEKMNKEREREKTNNERGSVPAKKDKEPPKPQPRGRSF